MSDEAFRHTVWTRLERCLAETDVVMDYLNAAIQHTGPLIGVEGSYSLSILLYGELFTAATTDRLAWDADQVEFDTEAGPCVEALRHGEHTGQVDLHTETRWPAWSAVSTLLGFRSAAGIPVEFAPGERFAINLYSPEPNAFTSEPLKRTQLFGEELARTLPTALRITEQAKLAAQLQQALGSRSTIDQALGVLMAQNRCTRDVAFGILRRASQHRNLKLREVAAAVIERYTGHAAAEPPTFTPPSPPRLRRGPASDQAARA